MRVRTYLLWLLPCLFVVIQFFLQNVANIFALRWMQDFHLNPVSLANLSSAYFYTYALMQVPAGVCFDRYSARMLLSVSLTFVGFSCLLLAEAHTFAMAYMARLIIGAACAFAFVGMLKITTQLFSAKQFPLMIGLSEMITMGLVSLALSLAAYWFIAHSWQSIQIITAAVSFILAVFAYLFGHDYEKNRIVHEPMKLSVLGFLKNRNVLLGALFCLLAFSLVSAFTSLWGIQFLVHTQHMSIPLATHINSAILIGIAIGSIAWGWFAKQTEIYRKLLLLATVLSLGLLVLLLLLPPVPYGWLYIGYLLAGICSAAYIPCLALIKRSVMPASQATAMAFANMMIMLGAPLFQMTIGYLIAHPFGQIIAESAQSYQLAMTVLPISALLALLAAYYLQDDKATAAQSIYTQLTSKC